MKRITLKRTICVACSSALLLPILCTFSGCGQDQIVLRIYNWEEYIDDGGEGSYVYDQLLDEGVDETSIVAPSILDDFELWYEQTYHKSVRVEYSCFGTNEDLYNQLKLGDTYDLVCPSEYMIMKLASENMLEPLPVSFFDETDEQNTYIQNVSPYIKDVFDSHYITLTKENGDKEQHSWGEYAAGYMWGTTGFIYNPELVDSEDLSHWSVLLDTKYKNKVTTKDNVRDTYFIGLAILYQDELIALKNKLESGEIGETEFSEQASIMMNDTSPDTVAKVQNILLEMKSNIYGFETDSGKLDMVKGIISINFAWSGDAVYAIDTAESENVFLNYYVPDECANLWFDGWVMPKNENRSEETKHAAMAYINYMSKPESAIRNMYYIGYSSVIAGDEVLEYINDTYGVEEGDEEDAVPYDIGYFFGEEATIYTYEDQLERQLFAQYPTLEVMRRCIPMEYFADEAGERINELWTKVKGETLDAWAIIVICVCIVAIAAFVVFVKLGGKIDFFRLKPKKGYRLIKQEPYRK